MSGGERETHASMGDSILDPLRSQVLLSQPEKDSLD